MKTMTCKQLYGPCDAPIQGATAEEMMENSQKNANQTYSPSGVVMFQYLYQYTPLFRIHQRIYQTLHFDLALFKHYALTPPIYSYN